MLGIFLVQPLYKLAVLVQFELNQSYIAQNLCVQKDKKDNACQGRCVLAERLKISEPQESQDIPLPNILKEEIPTQFIETLFAFDLQVEWRDTHSTPHYQSSMYCHMHVLNLLRPPEVSPYYI